MLSLVLFTNTHIIINNNVNKQLKSNAFGDILYFFFMGTFVFSSYETSGKCLGFFLSLSFFIYLCWSLWRFLFHFYANNDIFTANRLNLFFYCQLLIFVLILTNPYLSSPTFKCQLWANQVSASWLQLLHFHSIFNLNFIVLFFLLTFDVLHADKSALVPWHFFLNPELDAVIQGFASNQCALWLLSFLTLPLVCTYRLTVGSSRSWRLLYRYGRITVVCRLSCLLCFPLCKRCCSQCKNYIHFHVSQLKWNWISCSKMQGGRFPLSRVV